LRLVNGVQLVSNPFTGYHPRATNLVVGILHPRLRLVEIYYKMK
jgi:hypothetical protein